MWRCSVEDQVLEDSSTSRSSTQAVSDNHRNVWVLTAYGISGLGLLGVLLYYFSTYITH
jgi:hypothetical protein